MRHRLLALVDHRAASLGVHRRRRPPARQDSGRIVGVGQRRLRPEHLARRRATSFVAVAAGGYHSLALAGPTGRSPPGAGTTTARRPPPAGNDFVAVAAGAAAQPGVAGRRVDRRLGRRHLGPSFATAGGQRLRGGRGRLGSQPGAAGRRVDRRRGATTATARRRPRRRATTSWRSPAGCTTAWRCGPTGRSSPGAGTRRGVRHAGGERFRGDRRRRVSTAWRCGPTGRSSPGAGTTTVRCPGRRRGPTSWRSLPAGIHNLALRADGSIVALGHGRRYGQVSGPPAGNDLRRRWPPAGITAWH